MVITCVECKKGFWIDVDNEIVPAVSELPVTCKLCSEKLFGAGFLEHIHSTAEIIDPPEE